MITLVNEYEHLASESPTRWSEPCHAVENKLHQLSPFIGKLKSSIASDLILQHTNQGELVFDPFSGSGTIPLQSLLLGRRSVAADVSDYSRILTLGKTKPPQDIKQALRRIDRIKEQVESIPPPDLRTVPSWVRVFFNPKTLKDAIRWAEILKKPGNEFYFSCFFGILHHQRPGFLSYPSSHLVPYLRDNKYPKDLFPEMYEYREVYPRLARKVERALSSHEAMEQFVKFYHAPIQELRLKRKVDHIITSPPYMNALDYVRDNRLRLWFANSNIRYSDKSTTSTHQSCQSMVESLVKIAENTVRNEGKVVLVIGEQNSGFWAKQPIPRYFHKAFTSGEGSFALESVVSDTIPDIRRARRNCHSVKKEIILTYVKK